MREEGGGWQEGVGRRKEDAGEAESQLQSSPSARPLLRKPHPRTGQLGSVVLSQRPDILPLPEHLQLNRKQRNDSPVAEFQLSLEGAGAGGGRQDML